MGDAFDGAWFADTFEAVKNWGRWGADDERGALNLLTAEQTAAAAALVVVFIAFGVTGPIPPTELGITLSLAVLLDATIVRVLLVPATMALIGDRNWYLPRWLDRVLPRVHFRH
jgi:hypothetical protein